MTTDIHPDSAALFRSLDAYEIAALNCEASTRFYDLLDSLRALRQAIDKHDPESARDIESCEKHIRERWDVVRATSARIRHILK